MLIFLFVLQFFFWAIFYGIGRLQQRISDNKIIDEQNSLVKKYYYMILLYDQWVCTFQNGKHISEYLKREGYLRIAVYGLGFIGKRVLAVLENSGIEIVYVVDKNASAIEGCKSVVNKIPEYQSIDAIIVCSNYYFFDIETALLNETTLPIINIESLLLEL